jgi:hypothetical protein
VDEFKKFLDIKETIKNYGGSEAFWRKIVFTRAIPVYKRGDRVTFKREDLDAYFDSRCIPAATAGAGLRVSA